MKAGTTLACTTLVVALLALAVPFTSFAEQSRGLVLSIRDEQGQEIGLYTGSYALLIGISDYTAGWPDLENIRQELQQIETMLNQHGFIVETVMNPTSEQMQQAFKNFIQQYGYDTANRLLFVFSGHGHSRMHGKKGYLVPADAPNPLKDPKGFLRTDRG